MSGTQELADAIWRTEDTVDFGGYSSRDAQAVADHLWAEGYRKPRIVGSVADVEILPDWTVVRSRDKQVGELVTVAGRKCVFWAGNECEDELSDINLPATVLFAPDGN